MRILLVLFLLISSCCLSQMDSTIYAKFRDNFSKAYTDDSLEKIKEKQLIRPLVYKGEGFDRIFGSCYVAATDSLDVFLRTNNRYSRAIGFWVMDSLETAKKNPCLPYGRSNDCIQLCENKKMNCKGEKESEIYWSITEKSDSLLTWQKIGANGLRRGPGYKIVKLKRNNLTLLTFTKCDQEYPLVFRKKK